MDENCSNEITDLFRTYTRSNVSVLNYFTFGRYTSTWNSIKLNLIQVPTRQEFQSLDMGDCQETRWIFGRIHTFRVRYDTLRALFGLIGMWCVLIVKESLELTT